jgi:hypothetical protein
MFKTKYNTTLLDSKWNPIKRNVILEVLPRKDEFIYYGETYYRVISLVHKLEKKHDIFIVVEDFKEQEESKLSENQVNKK